MDISPVSTQSSPFIDCSEYTVPPPPPPPPPTAPLEPNTKKAFNTARDTFKPVRLHFAINEGNIDETRRLIESGIDINFQVHGNSPLFLAVLKEQYDIAHVLVDAGADVRKPEKFRWLRQPIHLAADVGDLSLVRNLIEHGASVYAADASLMTPLHWAANAGHLELVNYLLDVGAHVNAKDDCGRTALFRAVEGNHIELVRVLFTEGSLVNLQDQFGWSAVYHSIVCGHMDMIRELLSYGCNLQIRDRKGETALHVAVGRVHRDNLIVLCRSSVNYYMRERRVPTPAVHKAIQAEDCSLEIVQLLVDYGVPVNARSVTGDTALAMAAKDGRVDLLMYLVAAGADLASERWLLERDWPERLRDEEEVCEELCKLAECRVQELAVICKFAIRCGMAPNIRSKIGRLPLPKKLQQFLHIQ